MINRFSNTNFTEKSEVLSKNGDQNYIESPSPPIMEHNSSVKQNKSIVTTTNGHESMSSKPKGNFPFTSQRYLTEEFLYSYSAVHLRIMRNEVYARHGYIFNRSGEMIEVFNSKNWYRNIEKVSSDDTYIYNNLFSDIERFNVELIRKVENSKQ